MRILLILWASMLLAYGGGTLTSGNLTHEEAVAEGFEYQLTAAGTFDSQTVTVKFWNATLGAFSGSTTLTSAAPSAKVRATGPRIQFSVAGGSPTIAVQGLRLPAGGSGSGDLARDADGNLNISGQTLSGFTGTAENGVFVGDLSAFGLVRPDGGMMGRLYGWFEHDDQGGEVILESNHRIAFAPGPNGALQQGLSYSTTSTQFAYYQARYSPTVGVPLGESLPLFFNAGTYGVALEDQTHVGIQGRATASGDNEMILFAGSTFPDGEGIDADMPEIAALTVDGLRDPKGNSAPFVTLTDGSISLPCSTTKAFQNHVVTLAENSTLSFSGATAGMRGTIFVIQDGTGSRTLTLPANAATQTGFAISTTANKVDRLDWIFDGNYYYFDSALAWNLPIDADASAFLTAASISTGSTEGIALNNLVLTLKSGDNLWSNKIVEAWPLIGGNSTAHAQGLKGVQDATFGAGVTHNSNGITGNASSTGWMNSGLNISALGLRDDIGLYWYNREATTTAGGRMAGCISTANDRFYVTEASSALYGNGPCSPDLNTCSVSMGSDDRGHYWFGRTSSISATIRFNTGSQTVANSANTAPTHSPYFLAMNSVGTAANGTNANLAFAAVTKGLTTDQYNTLKAAVDAFETAIGRANP